MTHILKYLSSLLLIFALIGCQNDTDSSNEMAQQVPQQQQQQPNQQMGQMQQPSAPDIDVSDDEVETFVDASVDAREIQIEAQQKMVGIIEDEGLDVETYQEISKSMRPGQAGEEADVSDEQMEKYESASKNLREVQNEIQQDVATTIEDNGMDMQRFQQISQAAQQDRELQQKIQSKMQEKMQDGQGGMQRPSGN